MIRQHQFEKVELVSMAAPETRDDEHERRLACAETVLQKLELHYRVMTLCAGDMGLRRRKTSTSRSGCRPGQGGAIGRYTACSVVRRFPGAAHGGPERVPDGKHSATCTRSTGQEWR